MTGSSRRRFIAGSAALATLALTQKSRAMDATLSLLTFPGSYNLAIWLAMEQGLFAARGLTVARAAPRTSLDLITAIDAGRHEIGSSSLDNVIAYQAGQGAVALEDPANLFAFMNVERNLVLPLVVTAEIGSIEDLRGKTLAVDAIGTGFSFVLRDILRHHGLAPGDYRLEAVGNAEERLKALADGLHAGAILTPPFDARAVAMGLNRIASSRDIVADYQGTAFITSRVFAERQPDLLIAFIAAMLESYEIIGDPARRAMAADILMRHQQGLAPEAALRAVEKLALSLTPDFNEAGMEAVLRLRRRYGEPKRAIIDASRAIDTGYLEAARALRATSPH